MEKRKAVKVNGRKRGERKQRSQAVSINTMRGSKTKIRVRQGGRIKCII